MAPEAVEEPLPDAGEAGRVIPASAEGSMIAFPLVCLVSTVSVALVYLYVRVLWRMLFKGAEEALWFVSGLCFVSLFAMYLMYTVAGGG